MSRLSSLNLGASKALLARFSKPAKRRRLLIAESDGFTLRALVVQVRGQQLRIEQQLESRAAEPAAAVGELLAGLKEAEVAAPKEALLVSSGVVPALLKLPVQDSKSLGERKMLELVRWEMDGLFSEQVSLWNIGWVLIGRGYLNEAQRDQILDEMSQHDLTQGRSNRAPARFGEAAISHGFITRTQLEECLKLQERLHLLDDTLVCGWTLQAVSAGSQPGLRLCCAMSQQLQQEWVAAFSAQQIRLHRIYPAATAAAALLPEAAGPQVLLELRQGLVSCSQLQEGQLVQLAQQKCCDRSILDADLRELVQPMLSAEVGEIFVTGDHPRRQQLADALSEQLQRSLRAVDEVGSAQPSAPSLFTDPCLSARLGALRHFLSRDRARGSVSIQGQEPPPPLYRRPAAQIAAAVLLAVAGAVGSEGYFYQQTEQISASIRDNEVKLSRIEAANGRLKSENQEYQVLNEQVATLKAEYGQLKGRKEAIEAVLVRRERFTRALLPMLASSIPEQVRLTSLVEQGWYQFELHGWALDQTAIETFNQQLSRALNEWKLRISDSPSEAGPGWQDMDGFNFSFTIEPRA